MAEQGAGPTGPDFSEGVDISALREGCSLHGQVGGVPVILSRFDGCYFAVSGACTHYGAELAAGLQRDGVIRCPLHHACFDLRSGEALVAPALKPLDRWKVEQEGGRLYVRGKEGNAAGQVRQTCDPKNIVIIGGGAAGFACAWQLRRLGYSGSLIILSADSDPPYDRPNLSKDYLAGKAPEEWMPLEGGEFYADNDIDLRLRAEVAAIDVARRAVTLTEGESLPFDRLLIATGAKPIQLEGDMFVADNAFTLRSMDDARRIIARLDGAKRPVLLGAGFIGLEAAAALHERGLEVEIVSQGALPFDRMLGHDVALFFKTLHEKHGVRFHLGRTARGWDGRTLLLDDGASIEADLLLLGIGVRPNVALAEAAGIDVNDGIIVDAQMQTSIPGFYAAGDVANYPEPGTNDRVRVEHWAVAQQQGRIAAYNMLGEARSFGRIPFFWTEQYGTALRFSGYAGEWTEVAIDGFLADENFTARYFDGWRMRASASVGRDRENLEEEVRLEEIGAKDSNGAVLDQPHRSQA